MRWAGHVAGMEDDKNAYTILVGKSESERPTKRPRRKREYNTKMGFRQISFRGVNWIHLAQCRD
jgi:hypothetical protein